MNFTPLRKEPRFNNFVSTKTTPSKSSLLGYEKTDAASPEPVQPSPYVETIKHIPGSAASPCTIPGSLTLYLGSDSDRSSINDLIYTLIEFNEEYNLHRKYYIDGKVYSPMPIKLYINNPVNIDFYDMEALINAITHCHLSVHTYCLSSVMGIALPIFLAGCKRYCYKTSRFRYDDVYEWDYEHYSEFDLDNDEIQELNQNIADFIVFQTKSKKTMELLTNDYIGGYIDATTALSLGIVDEII